jgi:hypothetical protein
MVIVLEEMRILLIIAEEVGIGSRVGELHLAVGLLVLESVSRCFLVK